jgi:acetyltransferase-like isoleucine patch superfamily enzyme
MIKRIYNGLKTYYHFKKYKKHELFIARHVSIRNCKFENDVTVGPNSRLSNVKFGGNDHISNNVSISDADLDQYVKVGAFSALKDISIGSYSYIANESAIGRTTIGKYCSIGSCINVSSGCHPTRDFVSTHPIFFSTQRQCGISYADKEYFNEYSPVKIGNDVWIGTKVFVLDGVTIGDGAIIGAGAIVTKDVSPYAIVGGVPAKLIRFRFDEEEIDFLLRFKWWDRDPDWVKENYKDFHNIKSFMQKYKS